MMYVMTPVAYVVLIERVLQGNDFLSFTDSSRTKVIANLLMSHVYLESSGVIFQCYLVMILVEQHLSFTRGG